MKSRSIIIFFIAYLLTVQNICRASVNDYVSEPRAIKTFKYSDLCEPTQQIIEEVFDECSSVGCIAIDDMPAFYNSYEEFIEYSHMITNFSPSRKTQKLENREYFHEGFAKVKEETREAYNLVYKKVVDTAAPVGSKIFSLLMHHIKQKENLSTKVKKLMISARPFHYFSLEHNNLDWIGTHRDLGVFTLMCPEVFYKAQRKIEKPENSGAYIKEVQAEPPSNSVLFLVGTAMELFTNGNVIAPEHCIKRAPTNDSECHSLSLFYKLKTDTILHCDNPAVIEKYREYFEHGMTYARWENISLARNDRKKIEHSVG